MGSPNGPAEHTVLVIQPDVHCSADLFGMWFTAAGLTLQVIRPFAGERVPTELSEDALMVLGGPMSANDDEAHPWLAEVRHLLKVAATGGVPTLGICLGGQLLAKALGGTVTRGESGPEVGVVDLVLRPAATRDPLFAGLPNPAAAPTYHSDAIADLPEGAVILARSDVYPHQAFRIGTNAWGLQFHPEVSVDAFAKWAEAQEPNTPEAELTGPGVAAVRQRREELLRTGEELANRFADVVLLRP